MRERKRGSRSIKGLERKLRKSGSSAPPPDPGPFIEAIKSLTRPLGCHSEVKTFCENNVMYKLAEFGVGWVSSLRVVVSSFLFIKKVIWTDF